MSKKLTTEEFISKAIIVHGDRYDYSKVKYIDSRTKVCIICSIHGEFWQRPNGHLRGANCNECGYIEAAEKLKFEITNFKDRANTIHQNKYDYSQVIYENGHTKINIICSIHGLFTQTPSAHLSGQGCPKCGKISMGIKQTLSTEDFIERSRCVHGDKYDYSKVEYIHNQTKVCIICPVHGEFWQTPNDHMREHGCSKCYGWDKTTEEWIQQAKNVHGDKYDYSNAIYKNNRTKVSIICSIHGEFKQLPNSHLSGKSCAKCSGKYLGQDFFIEKSIIIHNNKYDYSKVEYIHNKKPVCIICPIHGEFEQQPNTHLNGSGCIKCAGHFMDREYFIEKSNIIHGNKYDYSKVLYKTNRSKVIIICPIHGEFWQTPDGHLRGNGCPRCNESKLEREINQFLTETEINFERQKRFDWLGRQSLDFYLPDHNIGIECQGEQHFRPVDFTGRGEEWAKKEFVKNQDRDQRKIKLCEENSVKILYFNYFDNIKDFSIKI